MAFGFDDAAIILGSILPSIFKGKKTKQAPQQTPEQLALVRWLTQMGKGNMGQGAANKQPTYDAMNMISRMFGGGMGQYGQQPQQGAANPMVANIFRQNPNQRV